VANEPEPMLSVEDAQERLLSAVGEPLPGENVPLADAFDRSSQSPSGAPSTCRPGTTARWTGSRYGRGHVRRHASVPGSLARSRRGTGGRLIRC